MSDAKRLVTMTSTVTAGDVVFTTTATDHVPVGDLDAYVADARTRWQSVTVGDPQEG